MNLRGPSSMPAKNGCSRSSSSSGLSVSMPFSSGALPDGIGLFGDVDADRAPGDAAPAADAAGVAELVVPGGELVGQPLAVAAARRVADHTAGDVGVRRVEAGVPAPRAGRRSAAQVGLVLDRHAE